MKLTFDFNCIISVEKKEKTSIHLDKLLKLHDNEKITVCIPAISGNEKLKSGEYTDNFLEFKERINKLTQRPLEILAPMLCLGLSFIGYCVLGGDDLMELDTDIHNILFPNIPYSWEDYVKINGDDIKQINPKWMNPRCDAISMWCHIHYQNDIFVSNDNNFFKKEKYQKLIKLGAQRVLSPSNACEILC